MGVGNKGIESGISRGRREIIVPSPKRRPRRSLASGLLGRAPNKWWQDPTSGGGGGNSSYTRRRYAVIQQSNVVLPENLARVSGSTIVNSDPIANVWVLPGPEAFLPVTLAVACPAGTPVTTVTVDALESDVPAGAYITWPSGDVVQTSMDAVEGATTLYLASSPISTTYWVPSSGWASGSRWTNTPTGAGWNVNDIGTPSLGMLLLPGDTYTLPGAYKGDVSAIQAPTPDSTMTAYDASGGVAPLTIPTNADMVIIEKAGGYDSPYLPASGDWTADQVAPFGNSRQWINAYSTYPWLADDPSQPHCDVYDLEANLGIPFQNIIVPYPGLPLFDFVGAVVAAREAGFDPVIYTAYFEFFAMVAKFKSAGVPLPWFWYSDVLYLGGVPPTQATVGNTGLTYKEMNCIGVQYAGPGYGLPATHTPYCDWVTVGGTTTVTFSSNQHGIGGTNFNDAHSYAEFGGTLPTGPVEVGDFLYPTYFPIGTKVATKAGGGSPMTLTTDQPALSDQTGIKLAFCANYYDLSVIWGSDLYVTEIVDPSVAGSGSASTTVDGASAVFAASAL